MVECHKFDGDDDDNNATSWIIYFFIFHLSRSEKLIIITILGDILRAVCFANITSFKSLVSRTILVQRREWVKYGWRSQMLNNNRLKRFKQQQQQLYINDTMFIKLLRIHERRTYCLLWHELQFFQTDDLFFVWLPMLWIYTNNWLDICVVRNKWNKNVGTSAICK